MFVGEKLVFEMRDSVIPIKSKSMSSSVRRLQKYYIGRRGVKTPHFKNNTPILGNPPPISENPPHPSTVI